MVREFIRGGAFPRTRGGDPIKVVNIMNNTTLFPAHAGVIPCSGNAGIRDVTFPRTRGGDPIRGTRKMDNTTFSPHTRG